MTDVPLTSKEIGVVKPATDETKPATDETKPATNATKPATNATKPATNATKLELSEEEKRILFVIKENPVITQKKIQEETNISLGTVKRILPKLQEKGILARRGSRRSGKWEILG